VLLLNLGGLIAKVLLLGLDDYRKLRLFSFYDLNQLFKVSNLSEIFYLL
jgi:hypothetical protein